MMLGGEEGMCGGDEGEEEEGGSCGGRVEDNIVLD